MQMLRSFSGHFSAFSSDIYPDMGVVFFGFFSGFPQTTSSSCSGFAWDIYLDIGVGLFGFSTTSSRCSSFSWDLYMYMGVVFFGFSTHYIIQLLWCFSGH